MKIVIDIEEGWYNWIMSHASKNPGDYANAGDLSFRTAIERGIVLPNGHGDLIDRDVARKEFDEACLSWEGGLLKYVPTVVPADK